MSSERCLHIMTLPVEDERKPYICELCGDLVQVRVSFGGAFGPSRAFYVRRVGWLARLRFRRNARKVSSPNDHSE